MDTDKRKSCNKYETQFKFQIQACICITAQAYSSFWYKLSIRSQLLTINSVFAWIILNDDIYVSGFNIVRNDNKPLGNLTQLNHTWAIELIYKFITKSEKIPLI